MDKKCLKRYRANRRELLSLERTLERLYMQLEDVPEVSGKVSKSSDDFPYIEQHVTVQMQEPKKASEIKDRIRKKEKRHKALLADMAEAERIIMKMPEGLSRQILEQVYLEGMSQQGIADRLNADGVLSPSEYKRSLGMKYISGFKSNPQAKWSAVAVGRILKNPLYIGVMVPVSYTHLTLPTILLV